MEASGFRGFSEDVEIHTPFGGERRHGCAFPRNQRELGDRPRYALRQPSVVRTIPGDAGNQLPVPAQERQLDPALAGMVAPQRLGVTGLETRLQWRHLRLEII